MRVSLSAREGERLFLALLPTTTDAGGARYPELIDFLRSNNAKWYDIERDIANKVGGWRRGSSSGRSPGEVFYFPSRCLAPQRRAEALGMERSTSVAISPTAALTRVISKRANYGLEREIQTTLACVFHSHLPRPSLARYSLPNERKSRSAEELPAVRLSGQCQPRNSPSVASFWVFVDFHPPPLFAAQSKQILAAMGADSPSRRAWLNRMRRRFMSLDAFRVGVLGASDLLQVHRRSLGQDGP